ncbi:MAG: leucine-rich repeat-containing protein kinase family protein [Janthinobacterium lividum]
MKEEIQGSRSLADPTLAALRRGALAGAAELRLGAGVASFPAEIFGLADTLEILDLGRGTLDSLPRDLGRLHKLRVIFLSGHRFTRLPPALGDCAALGQIGCRGTGLTEVPGEALPKALRWLTLTDNRIETLPKTLGERPVLQKLMLAGNRLTALPGSLEGAGNLELVRLAANRFEALPPWLTDLPRLAWAAWAGNPGERRLPADGRAAIAWDEIETGAVLGEGASGRVHGALWRRPGAAAPQPVALKLFKGAMTSDGLPKHEMAACLLAGPHPHLVGALGRVADHLDGSAGLVMPLLPSHWRSLAGPPSLATCSRDVYDPSLRLTTEQALRIARGIAGAVTHLHARGLMHGDLYAHNILWDGADGQAALSDFGAASALPDGSAGEAWRRIEVRAFGLLLEELRACCEAPPASVLALARACAGPPSDRPIMADALHELARDDVPADGRTGRHAPPG